MKLISGAGEHGLSRAGGDLQIFQVGTGESNEVVLMNAHCDHDVLRFENLDEVFPPWRRP